ncbi:MAG: DNA repair protein RecN [Bacteroidota bacterium]
MLTNLSIQNYALIDDLSVGFSNGLSIITGETGAGKSILLGGLSLVMGKRADLSSVKDSTKKCIIEATFDITKYQLKGFFKSKDLDYEPLTIIRREILPSGKSRAFVNDSPVNLDSLQSLSLRLLDIHSQHQTLQLTNDDFQFKVIDALAQNTKLLDYYAEELKKYRKLEKTLKDLEFQKAEDLKELDYNNFLYKELEDANLVSGELKELEDEYETLNNVEDIQEKLSATHQLLSNEEIGIIKNLTEIKAAILKISGYSIKYREMYQRIDSSLIEIDDIFSEIESLQGDLEVNPERLNQVSLKLQVLNSLFQKHNVSEIQELISIKEALSTKIQITENLDERILNLKEQLEISKRALDDLAFSLREKRLQTIPNLTNQLKDILVVLGMPNAKFKIELKPSESYLPNGKDALDFMFSANKGGNFNELKKAASGGELSRIMLAIKSILTKYTQLPTIMFDEIDTGVSGEISNKMAMIMQEMSKKMQVFSITHLPQIAAKGDTHFKVYKQEVDNVTQSQIKKLSHEERIVEIAQMLGGSNISTSAVAHAKELLN